MSVAADARCTTSCLTVGSASTRPPTPMEHVIEWRAYGCRGNARSPDYSTRTHHA